MSDAEGTISVQVGSIKELLYSSDWLSWKEEMHDLLSRCGYHDLLGHNREPPSQEGTTPEIWDTRNETWLSRQETACALIRMHQPLFMNRFLEGLGPSYSTFLLSFHQAYDLLPTRDKTGAITRPGVTFSEVIAQAERAEAKIKLQNQPTVPAMLRKYKHPGDRDRQLAKHCSYCKKYWHAAEE
ncbi:hypothetical protein IQ07DRAFT_650142 [Pyrenochaeta sp. DS3sAY3a]|nr:hypothetical protein IQ07DRAFT_650142 [Pyrenochaeta sp. DS3sAY3a]